MNMPKLYVEMSPNDGEVWVPIGEQGPEDRYGSVSDVHDDGSSDVYIFGVDPVENVGEIKRSVQGVDVVSGNTREIDSVDLEEVARLSPGEQHEMTVRPRPSPAAMLIRFTYGED